MTADRGLLLYVNGEEVSFSGPADIRLIDVLREHLRLTGTKEGCSIGVCGLCTVLVDGEPISGCLLLAAQVVGREVVTIEGVADRPWGKELQEAFISRGGFQCGVCTPGQILAAAALLGEDPSPDRGEIAEHMMGNLCRCTGYEGIVAAIESAAR